MLHLIDKKEARNISFRATTTATATAITSATIMAII
jgi:hypothetical protein